ncbi:MAG TPA: SagB family peptide dehydrogenase [Streptosporangiaceae bacterium]|nr:SagB family peptide dehydrogenase [Streptosporangiaceae bacterium]
MSVVPVPVAWPGQSLLRLRPGVSAVHDGAGRLWLVRGAQREHVGGTGDNTLTVLRRLAAAACTQEQLLAEQDHTEQGTGHMLGGDLLGRLWRGGWLSVTLEHSARPLLTLESRGPWPAPQHLVPTGLGGHEGTPPLRLSRFAVLHRDADRLIVESPLSPVVVTVCDPMVLPVIFALAAPAGTEPAHAMPDHVSSAVVHTLAACGLATAAEQDQPRACWEPHDLWFHQRSRQAAGLSRNGTEAGATPPPAVPPASHPGFGTPRLALARPDLTALQRTEAAFTTVAEARRSQRQFDDSHPLTAAEAGEFLYRCARVRWSGQDGGIEVTSRPYPSAGALHELEVYLVAVRVAGLTDGMYHYRPDSHELESVPAPGQAAARLAQAAALAIGATAVPQALLVVSARFDRVMWKYPGFGYSLVLKDVGALLQTMSLVATAMGLAGCALGGGDSAVFASATGIDPLAEASVGEFVLGSAPGRGEALRKVTAP